MKLRFCVPLQQARLEDLYVIERPRSMLQRKGEEVCVFYRPAVVVVGSTGVCSPTTDCSQAVVGHGTATAKTTYKQGAGTGFLPPPLSSTQHTTCGSTSSDVVLHIDDDMMVKLLCGVSSAELAYALGCCAGVEGCTMMTAAEELVQNCQELLRSLQQSCELSSLFDVVVCLTSHPNGSGEPMCKLVHLMSPT